MGDCVPFALWVSESLYVASLTEEGRRREIESERANELHVMNPKPGDLAMPRVKIR